MCRLLSTLCGTLSYRLIKFPMIALFSWASLMGTVSTLSTFPAIVGKTIGCTRKPRLESISTQRTGANGGDAIWGSKSGARMRRHQLCSSVSRYTLIAMIAATTSAFAADPHNGERLAHRWCEACHVVSPMQQGQVADQAPPFAEIAKRVDPGTIAVFLLNSHPRMPDMNLSRMEAADLAAYIATLK